MLRVGVLASGSGTNFQALHDACACGYAEASIVLVVTNRADAGVIERASRAGVECEFVDSRSGSSREEYDKQVLWHFEQRGVELVCGAGYMRILSAEFVRSMTTLNVHPSLLPSFPGLHAIEQAFDAGVKVSGVTVHLMDAGLDSGPIVAQRAVEVGSSLEEFERRIHLAEYAVYPKVLRAWAAGLVTVDGRNVTMAETDDPPWAGRLPPGLE